MIHSPYRILLTFRVAEMAKSNGTTHVDMLHSDLIWRDLKLVYEDIPFRDFLVIGHR